MNTNDLFGPPQENGVEKQGVLAELERTTSQVASIIHDDSVLEPLPRKKDMSKEDSERLRQIILSF